MIQQIRSNKFLPSATTEKLLLNAAPSLPSGVKGIVRASGFLTPTQILKLFPARYFLTNENGDYIADEDGNRFEILV